MPETLRDHLKQVRPDLATTAEHLWLKSSEIHERQNRPDSNENGRLHVEAVERNIWRLLKETRNKYDHLNLSGLKPEEVFLLSCAACCHDFDKGLKSANPPPGFLHGEGSGAFVTANAGVLGLNDHQAGIISSVIAIHHRKTKTFLNALKELPTEEYTPFGPINLRRMAVLLKAADILHCDHSRVQQYGIDPSAFQGLERKKYLARKVTTGWNADGSRILIQAHPGDREQRDAFGGAFQFMKTQEWDAVADGLERWEFPNQLALHDSTALVLGPTEFDESARPPTSPKSDTPVAGAVAPAEDLLCGCPEAQSTWVGRLAELAELRTAWLARTTRAYAVVGLGGEGKTALARRFAETVGCFGDAAQRPVIVWWSFYFNRAADEFLAAALGHFKIPLTEEGLPLSPELRARKLVDLLRTGIEGRRMLLVLDGLEAMQERTGGREGRVADLGLRELLTATFTDARPDGGASGLILITTRAPLRDLLGRTDPRYGELTLEELPPTDGATLLWERCGLPIKAPDAEAFVKKLGGHALTLTLVGALLRESDTVGNDLDALYQMITASEVRITDPNLTTRRQKYYRLPGYVLRHCREALTAEDRQFLRLLSCCVRPATRQDIEDVFLQPLTTPRGKNPFNDKLAGREYAEVRDSIVRRLLQMRLIDGNERSGYDMHPLIRGYFYAQEDARAALTAPRRKAIHSRFFDVLVDRPKKHQPDTLDEMRPLIDAVLHGCRAQRYCEALADVYYPLIARFDASESVFYHVQYLGAVETDLQLLSSFFPNGDFDGEPFAPNDKARAALINNSAAALSVSGRPGVAVPMILRSLDTEYKRQDWDGAGRVCWTLCEAHMNLGRLPDADRAAADALDYISRLAPDHDLNRGYRRYAYGTMGVVAALRGEDGAAGTRFSSALKLPPARREHWDWRDWHGMWLARCGVFDQARSVAAASAQWCAQQGGLSEATHTLFTQASVERLAWAADDPKRRSLDQMYRYARDAVDVGWRSGFHHSLTCAMLEAGRCAITYATHDESKRPRLIREAERYLTEAEDRAAYGGYCLIEADANVARAQLARFADEEEQMRVHCQAAIAICNDPNCGYAWAKQDAEALQAG